MKITSKGQVTIPRRLRVKYGLLPHGEVTFHETEGGVLVRPTLSKPETIEQRFLHARGVARTRMTSDEVMRLTRGDRRLTTH